MYSRSYKIIDEKEKKMEQNDIPEVTSNLRNNYVCVPEKINLCTGIYFF